MFRHCSDDRQRCILHPAQSQHDHAPGRNPVRHRSAADQHQHRSITQAHSGCSGSPFTHRCRSVQVQVQVGCRCIFLYFIKMNTHGPACTFGRTYNVPYGLSQYPVQYITVLQSPPPQENVLTTASFLGASDLKGEGGGNSHQSLLHATRMFLVMLGSCYVT
jgi:hypothetical protein